MELEVERIDESRFRDMEGEWNALLGRSEADNVFLRWEWIHTWWEIFGKGHALFLWTARQEGRLVGIAPFYIESAAFPSARRLRFCSYEMSPDHMDIIAEHGLESSTAREFLDRFRKCAEDWDVLEVDNLSSKSSLLCQSSLLSEYGLSVERSFECPYVLIPQMTFDEYVASRSGLADRGMKRKLFNLTKKEGIRHVIVRDSESHLKAMRDLFKLHNARASDKGYDSRFTSGDVERFHERLSVLLLEKGILNLHLLYDGETPVGAQYAFQHGRKVCYFQGGFDPAYKRWSAGLLMIYLVLGKAFADGALEYDMLKGNEPYKALWSNATRWDMRLHGYSPTHRGSFARSCDGLIRGLRSAKRIANGLGRLLPAR